LKSASLYWSYFWTIFLAVIIVRCNPIQSIESVSTSTARAIRNNNLATKQALIGQAALSTEAYQNTTFTRDSQILISQSINWPIVFSESFDTNNNQWPTGPEDGDLSTVNFVVDGKYTINTSAKESFIYWARPDTPIVTDFRLEVDAVQQSGAVDGQFGLLIRQEDDNNYYLFKITNDQYFAVNRSTVDGWESIIDWTSNPVINISKFNHLIVIAKSTHFIFLINQQIVQEVIDTSIPSGQFGIMFGLFTPDDEAVFEFDNFILRAPGTPTETP
jgi:hypothetical protein